MSDLISRSDVLGLQRYSFGVSMLTSEEYIKVSDVDNILTAFDVDKVISEIRRRSGNEYRDIDGDYVPPMIETKKAIEIVKQGRVVSDDVCEWGIVDRPHNIPIYNTSCGKIRLQYATGIDIYCNCCGKKIKVVD